MSAPFYGQFSAYSFHSDLVNDMEVSQKKGWAPNHPPDETIKGVETHGGFGYNVVKPIS